MNLDELNAIGEVARQKVAREGGSIAAMTRAHTRAMVEALRDRMSPKSDGSRMVSSAAVRRFFDVILGGDADPDACEWRAGRDGIQAVAACGIPNNYWLETAKRLGVKACACGRPISFKEPAR